MFSNNTEISISETAHLSMDQQDSGAIELQVSTDQQQSREEINELSLSNPLLVSSKEQPQERSELRDQINEVREEISESPLSNPLPAIISLNHHHGVSQQAGSRKEGARLDSCSNCGLSRRIQMYCDKPSCQSHKMARKRTSIYSGCKRHKLMNHHLMNHHLVNHHLSKRDQAKGIKSVDFVKKDFTKESKYKQNESRKQKHLQSYLKDDYINLSFYAVEKK